MEDSNTRLLRLSVHGSIKSEAEENVDKSSSVAALIFNEFGKWWSNRQRNPHVQPVRTMVVSVTGNYMAIIDGYKIHFLSRANGFSEPVGYSNCSLEVGFYTNGVWLQELSTFSALTSLNYLIVYDINGKELSMVYIRHWKADCFALAMFVLESFWNISTSERNDRYTLAVLASDFTLHLIEYGSGSFHERSMRTISHGGHLKNIYPQGIVCCDFNLDESVIAVGGHLITNNGGCYRISLWRVEDFWNSLHLLQSIDLEDNGMVMTPSKLGKLILSPGCQYICFIDSQGRPRFVRVKQFPVWEVEEIHKPFDDYGREPDEEVSQYHNLNSKEVLKFSCFDVSQCVRVSTDKKLNTIFGIKDACWWSDDSVAVLKKDGAFAIVSVHDLGIVSQSRGELSYDRMHITNGPRKSIFILDVTQRNHQKEKFVHCNLRLISFQEYTPVELFNTLLQNTEFDFALLLADVYNLNHETVYKQLWLKSTYELLVEEILPKIKDKYWVLKECLERVCPSLDAMSKLIHHGLTLIDSLTSGGRLQLANVDTDVGRLCLIRLRLLQYHDRLETYLGINMGRYNAKEYRVFRGIPLADVAVKFAESGKIGALCLLFKCHVYSLTPQILDILNAIPETVAPYTYSQLLPNLQVSDCYILEREKDWVEEEAIINIIQKHDIRDRSVSRVSLCESTEHVVKAFIGHSYPSDDAITMWYKKRAMEIDKMSGQSENALALLDLGKQKGCRNLEDLWEDLSRFLWVIYTKSEADDIEINITFQGWQQLSSYDKFELMLRGVNEGTVLDRLREKAIPFMKFEALVKNPSAFEPHSEHTESFLVKWMKDITQKNQLNICDAIFMEECKTANSYSLFDTEIQCIRTGLDCVYACTRIDQWDLMSSVLSKLSMTCLHVHARSQEEQRYLNNRSREATSPQKQRKEWILLKLEKEVQQAIGHVEAGHLLSHYQVPKPIQFFKIAQNDEGMVKQLVILILSKFSGRQFASSDSEWVSMWDDLQDLQCKAFSFFNKQLLFIEYYKSLLKVGKFYLAKYQLSAIGHKLISVEKAESITIQVAREYFYAASSLHSPEIEKARLCLDLLPSSVNTAAEINLIDVVTKQLPALGVSIPPMQIKQVKDPMEIIRKVLTYTSTLGILQVDDLLDIARSLGMSSDDHIVMVEEAIAREAAASGEFTLTLNLCLSLIEQRYGPIWDLCAAMGRGPEVEGLNLKSRKALIGFALGHCDEASIGQLLNSWKEVDLSMRSTEIKRVLSIHDYLDCDEDEMTNVGSINPLEEENFIGIYKEYLPQVALNLPAHDSFNRNFLSKDRQKMLYRLIIRLPELSQAAKGYYTWQNFQNNFLISKSVSTILLGLGHGGVPPNDEMICHLAQVAMSEGRSLVGFGYLLNLTNCRKAVEFFEKQLGHREDDEEMCDSLEIAFKYGALQICGNNAIKRRRMLLKILARSLDDIDLVTRDHNENNADAESQFWKQWQSTILEVLNMTRDALEPKLFTQN